MMEGRKRMLQHEEVGEIKKGPWKVEEDEVLINHVRKYGPRDWSFIRSKGLLRRTGKSCRLRWVNKLRPDLKTGVKFSAEEERTVIDLQAQFGNKWARIATYLPGRTDNDVKNFWSSRQKRLARMLHTCSSSNTNEHIPLLDVVPSLEAPKLSSSSTEEEQKVAESQSCSSSHIDNTIKMVPFAFNHDPNAFQLDYIPLDQKMTITPDHQQPHLPFSQIPQLQTDFTLPLDTQDDIITKLGEHNFLNEFEKSLIGTTQIPMMSYIFEPDRSCQINGRTGSNDPMGIDGLIDNFPPIDIFDYIPSPSEWS